jgi:hypothetical protein
LKADAAREDIVMTRRAAIGDNPFLLFAAKLRGWLDGINLAFKLLRDKPELSAADADYFRRNLRAVEVLIDQDAIRSGAAAQGKPWQYFDLGHGYCSYDYFSKCPHRMACAQCSFYVPKESSRAQMLEASANLQRMLKEISLTEEAIAAVESGIELMNQLCRRLTDVPTPDGSTPRELSVVAHRELPVLSASETAERRQESRASG